MNSGEVTSGLAFVEHELKAPRPVRAGECQSRALRIAKYFGIASVVSSVLEIEDKPAFVEGGAAQPDAEFFADETAPSIASDEVAGGNFR